MQGPQLTRSESDKRIAGVCGGLAEYFDVDPTLIRILFVASIFFGGLGILLYIVLWIVLPRGTAGAVGHRTSGRGSSALHIAEERFARGEISAQELAQIRADLTGRI
jgi:phage shock protein PspC (stress-responsive transcriptional regulator)